MKKKQSFHNEPLKNAKQSVNPFIPFSLMSMENKIRDRDFEEDVELDILKVVHYIEVSKKEQYKELLELISHDVVNDMYSKMVEVNYRAISHRFSDLLLGYYKHTYFDYLQHMISVQCLDSNLWESIRSNLYKIRLDHDNQMFRKLYQSKNAFDFLNKGMEIIGEKALNSGPTDISDLINLSKNDFKYALIELHLFKNRGRKTNQFVTEHVIVPERHRVLMGYLIQHVINQIEIGAVSDRLIFNHNEYDHSLRIAKEETLNKWGDEVAFLIEFAKYIEVDSHCFVARVCGGYLLQFKKEETYFFPSRRHSRRYYPLLICFNDYNAVKFISQLSDFQLKIGKINAGGIRFILNIMYGLKKVFSKNKQFIRGANRD